MRRTAIVRAALTIDKGKIFYDYRFPYSLAPTSPKSGWTFLTPRPPADVRDYIIVALHGQGVR